jgi:omega-6 fatty acid desaturase (delta-12 desaturase)
MSESTTEPSSRPLAEPGLRSLVTKFETPSIRKSAYQILTSIGLFLAACSAMYWSLGISYLLTLALAIPTAGLLVRVFIVQHDCGHGSLFRSRKLNDLVGKFCSLLTLTPYAHWRRHHNVHHGHWNNLDRREIGLDLYATCLTVAEYQALSRWGRFSYRAVRHPILAHVLLPPLVFLFLYRVPFETPKTWTRERRSVYLTNVAVVTVLTGLILALGFWKVLLVQVPVIALTSMMGVGLFSLQHRFDNTVWARQGEWDVVQASLEGSSYFKLPRLLQWFSGNIGFHHVHHLSPRVPNYRLEACHNAIPALQAVRPMRLRDSFGAVRLTLWDEANRQMISFAEARKINSGVASPSADQIAKAA